MNNIFVTSAIISIIFLITKFLEMRFVEKESKPLKLLIRDTLLVYFSVISGHFLLKQINPIIHSVGGSAPQAFTDNPNF
jgi:hypothetical protein